MFGVQLCAEGKVPDLSSQRLQQVPVLPAIAQTQVRVSMAPASDNPTTIECKNQFSKNDEKGEINTPKRERLQFNYHRISTFLFGIIISGR